MRYNVSLLRSVQALKPRLYAHICAPSRGIYPIKTGDRNKNVHFFVEFDQQASVKRARALQIRDAKVHIVSFIPQLIEDFFAVSSTPSDRPTTPNRAVESKGSPLRPWNQSRHGATPSWASECTSCARIYADV